MTKARSGKRSRNKTPAQAGGPQSFAVSQRQRADRPQGDPTRLGWRRLLPLLVIAAGIVAYWNSFDGKLVFDDEKHIPDNPRIKNVLPLSETMSGRRPIVDLSLAINYSLGTQRAERKTWDLGLLDVFRSKEGELNLRGFHAFNLCVHLLAGLTLFGIVRRTVTRGPFDERVRTAGPWLALVIATIWIVHPLQTQSVTYLVQRAESMMGLFYLLTLYCVIRGAESRAGMAWYLCAVIACAIGMGCKAVIVTAPLVVLLYDRVFLARSFAELFNRRWLLYVGLIAACIVLVLCRVVKGVFAGLLWDPIPGTTVGFSVTSVTRWEYLISQPGVIAYYLKLSFWPRSLCLDYAWNVAERTRDVLLPTCLVILPLMAATIWGFLRKPWVGFVGAWFFIVLAPTSSFIPIKDLLFEHRMYLPLAAVIVMVVVIIHHGLLYLEERRGVEAWGRRVLGAILFVGVVVALTYGTIRRNTDYHDALGMWYDVITKRPSNPRGHLGLGTAVFALGEQARDRGDLETARELFIQAEDEFTEAVHLKESYADAWYNLGNALNENDKPVEAIAAYRKSMRYKSRNAKAHYNLANVLKNLAREEKNPARYEEAIIEYRRAIEYDPEHIRAHVNLGNTYKILGRYDEAIEIYNRALQIDPKHANTHHNLGDAYFQLGRYEEALREFELALQYDPTHTQARRGRDAALARLRELGGE